MQPRTRSRSLLLVLAYVLAGAVATSGSLRAQDRPPNVVILFADDLGYGDLACQGSTTIATPHLDRLASRGRRFTNFHAAQAVCSASRAALLTGCYPNRIGIHGALGPQSRHGLHDDETTLAELLRSRGFATAAFGKWHLGHHPPFLPRQHGFDEFYGLPYSNDMWVFHPDAGRGSYPALTLLGSDANQDEVIDREVSQEDQSRLTGEYTQRAVRFIEKNSRRPFLLYVAYAMPHVPLNPGEAFRGKSRGGLYGDVVEEIDASVGAISAALASAGILENTLLLFTSDNGPWLSYGEHAGSSGVFREGKGTAWEGGTRVPCIVHWPGKVPAGTASDARWMAIDVLPTVAGLVGAELPAKKIDGLDVWPWITGAANAVNPHDAYLHYYEVNQLQAISTGDGRWKMVLPHRYRTLGGRPGGQHGLPVAYEHRDVTTVELFDLAADPGETHNVLAAHPDVVARLEPLVTRARADLGDALTQQAGSGRRAPGSMPATP